MSEMNQEQLIEQISNMSVLDLSTLVKALEEKFGVSAAAAVSAAPVAAAAAEPVEEKTEFDIILKEVKDKIKVLKEVRVITGLGIKEAKDLVESAGPACKVKEGVPKAEAEAIVKKITEVGGVATME